MKPGAIAFAQPGFEDLVAAGQAVTAQLAVERFENGELSLGLQTDPRGRPCVLVGSVAPPDEQMLALLLAADTLACNGAAEITAVLPYLGYARQDRPEAGRGLGAAWVGRLLSTCGVDRVVTVDIHSARAASLLGLPVSSLSPARLFADELTAEGLAETAIVAPDEGAIDRARAVAQAAGMASEVAHMRKERTPAGVTHHELVGALNRRAVVVDDILDTGGTLVSCCRELERRGVEETTIVVTHGLFTGERWKLLPSLGVRAIYVTDSVPGVRRHASENVRVLSISPVLATGPP